MAGRVESAPGIAGGRPPHSHVAKTTLEAGAVPMVDLVATLREVSAAAARRRDIAAAEVAEESRRANEQAANAVLSAQSRLLLQLTEDQFEGRAPLGPEITAVWEHLFPDRPIINGHLATGAQMQRIQERQERQELIEWLVSKGRTAEEARAAVAAEYGETATPQAGEGAVRFVGDAADWTRAAKAVAQGQEQFEAELAKIFAPRPSPQRAAESGLQLRESASPITPAAVTAAAGTPVPVVLLTPGWGSSGYYSPAVLEQAARDRVIPAGTQMYADHPSQSQRQDRPERSVRDLVGVLTEDARWDGSALVSKAQFFQPWDAQFREMAGAVGLSILGSATDITRGTAEGRTGPIIQGLARINSVDVVTRAGRGGRIVTAG